MAEHECICVVVDFGQALRAERIAKRCGVKGCTICLGRGTVHSRLLDFLDLTEVRKEILFMVCPRDVARTAMAALRAEMALDKPNRGIEFSFAASHFIGTRHYEYGEDAEETGGSGMHSIIFVVVDKGRAEDAVDAARAAGARGGTIINARGSGIHDTDRLFAMPVEPEREVAMIVVKRDATRAVADAVRKALRIDDEGTGILFVVEAEQAYGLV